MFSFHTLCMFFFSYHPWISASKGWSLTTLFSTQMKWQETQPQEHHHLVLILLEFRHSFLPSFPSFTLTEAFVFSLYICSKQSLSWFVTLNWSEHFIWWVCFQICSGINNTHYYCILVKSFIWLSRVWLHCIFRSRVEYF